MPFTIYLPKYIPLLYSNLFFKPITTFIVHQQQYCFIENVSRGNPITTSFFDTSEGARTPLRSSSSLTNKAGEEHERRLGDKIAGEQRARRLIATQTDVFNTLRAAQSLQKATSMASETEMRRPWLEDRLCSVQRTFCIWNSVDQP